MKPIHQTTMAAALVDRCALSWRAASLAAAAVVDALAEAIPRAQRGHFGSLFAATREKDRSASLRQVIASVMSATGASSGAALEQIQVVCSAIADAWSDDDRHAVLAGIAPEVGDLFTRPHSAAPLDAHDWHNNPPATRTLSSSHPSAADPIATSPAAEPAHTLAAGHPRRAVESGTTPRARSSP